MTGRRGDGGTWRSIAAAGVTLLVAALVPIGLAARGAIVEDPRTGTLRGVDAGGRTVWSDAEAYWQRAQVTCAGPCPQVPAPRPGQRILSADDQSMVLVVPDEHGRAWLETWAGDRRTARLPVPSIDTVWRPNSDGTAAAAISGTVRPRRYEVRSFRRPPAERRGADQPDGWVTSAGPVPAATGFGCAGVRGDVVVATPQPRLVRPSGESVAVPGLDAGGECAFGRDVVVVAQLSATGTGAIARVVVIDGNGAVRWRADVQGDTRVRADQRSDRFIIVAEGTATERSADGTVLRTIPDADDARYDEQGRLVVLHHLGSVAWLPPAG
jgi:hypothetical protein